MSRARSAVVLFAGLAACSGRGNAPPAAPAATATGAPAAGALAPTVGPGAPPASPVDVAPTAGAEEPAGGASRGALAAPTKVALADVGLEAASLDRSVDPCVDFYQFACGGWLAGAALSSERASWSRAAERAERTATALASALEAAAGAAGGDPAARQLGDFYAACRDEPAAERSGPAALAPLLSRVRGVKDARTWLAAVVELHKLGIAAVWAPRVAPDRRAPERHALYLDVAGLGLLGAGDYTPAAPRERLDAYRAHLARMLGLASPGASGAQREAAAADVLAIETELAQLARTPAERQDLAASAQATDVRSLARKVRSVDWAAYLRQLGAASSAAVIVEAPRGFAALDALRGRFSWPQWSSYLTARLLDGLGDALPRAFADEARALRELVQGAERAPDRTARCVALTASALGDLLAQPYVAAELPATAQQAAAAVVVAVARAMSEQLAGLAWLSEPTRQAVGAKLAKLVPLIGAPARWQSYGFEVKRDDLAGNVVRGRAFATRQAFARVGQPVDRAAWSMRAFDVAPSYDPDTHRLTVPAGALQPPLFGQDRAIAANLGGLGVQLGHELIHAVDGVGAQLDGDGRLTGGWPAADLAQLGARGACIADQYATFEVLPRQYIAGELTQAENAADLGGVKAAFAAYRALRAGAARTYVADGFTEDQQFFLAAAQAMCERDRPEHTARRLATDPRAPAKFRVYGALRNFGAFADAFRCTAGTPMRPAQACGVW